MAHSLLSLYDFPQEGFQVFSPGAACWEKVVNRAERITLALQALAPTRLEVINQSGQHVSHAGDDGSGESHFHVIVRSDQFAGLSRLERQRLVHRLLAVEFAAGLHALSCDLENATSI